MATKIICDACGKEIKYGTDLLYYVTVRTNRSESKITDRPDYEIYDFCEDCYNEFINHSFKKKGNNDED